MINLTCKIESIMKNRVQIARNYSNVYRTLRTLNHSVFYDMEEAIKYVKMHYEFEGIIPISLKLRDKSGNVSEWDNY